METLDQAAGRLLAAISDALDAAVALGRLYAKITGEDPDIYDFIVSLEEIYGQTERLLGIISNEQ